MLIVIKESLNDQYIYSNCNCNQVYETKAKIQVHTTQIGKNLKKYWKYQIGEYRLRWPLMEITYCNSFKTTYNFEDKHLLWIKYNFIFRKALHASATKSKSVHQIICGGKLRTNLNILSRLKKLKVYSHDEILHWLKWKKLSLNVSQYRH